MLCLSRRRDEVIRIGHDTIVRVLEIRRDKVRLGITAPKEVEVHREEVYETIWGQVKPEEEPCGKRISPE